MRLIFQISWSLDRMPNYQKRKCTLLTELQGWVFDCQTIWPGAFLIPIVLPSVCFGTSIIIFLLYGMKLRNFCYFILFLQWIATILLNFYLNYWHFSYFWCPNHSPLAKIQMQHRCSSRMETLEKQSSLTPIIDTNQR